MDKVLGMLLLAMPAVAGFAAYGLTQQKGMGSLAGAALAGAAFAATDIAAQKLTGGGVAGLAFERVGLMLNPARQSWAALPAGQRSNLGYLATQKVGACFGTC